MAIWSMAKLGYHPGRILAGFAQRISDTVDALSPHACCNILWALSVLQARGPMALRVAPADALPGRLADAQLYLPCFEAQYVDYLTSAIFVCLESCAKELNAGQA